MNIQALVVIILRLMALDFLLRVAVQLTPQVLSLLHLYRQSPVGTASDLVVLPWLMLAGLLAVAVVLWFLALPIARLVSRGAPQELTLGALTLADCYSVAFIGVGLFYISSHLPQVLNWGHFLLKAAASHTGDSWKEQVQWYDVSQAIIPFIIGVVLFVNGRKWSVALARKDTRPAQPEVTHNQTSETGEL